MLLRPANRRFIARSLGALVQAVALVVCFQASGLARGLAEALALIDGVELHCDDCDDDTPNDCAPGCPNCHCGSVDSALLPPPMRGELLGMVVGSENLPVIDDGRAPKQPDLPSIYRPPRITLLS